MHREVLVACLPYVVAIIGLLGGQAIVLRFNAERPRLARLWRLHRDERGAVQSLSFVLTLPIFMVIMMFIVQLALVTMARISVEYSAFAAARSASVWFPANLGNEWLAENRVSVSSLRPVRVYEAKGRTYTVYRVPADGEKFDKVHLAAAMACMPICPSRDTGVPASHPGNAALPAIQRAYAVLAPGAHANTRIPARLANKLAYALANTRVEIEVHHCGDQVSGGDPPLYPEYPLELEYPTRYLRPNEIGWQDQIYVKVTHQYALLPGPGRLLATRADSPTRRDEVPGQIRRDRGVYSRALTATVRMGNEGQKPSATISTPGRLDRGTYVQPSP
ncbi:MAG: TadE/TadG family type IV pilus assembly protein [Planctomycetota bacterium]